MEQPAFISLFPFTLHWSFRKIAIIRKLILVLVNYSRMNYVRLGGMKESICGLTFRLGGRGVLSYHL